MLVAAIADTSIEGHYEWSSEMQAKMLAKTQGYETSMIPMKTKSRYTMSRTLVFAAHFLTRRPAIASLSCVVALAVCVQLASGQTAPPLASSQAIPSTALQAAPQTTSLADQPKDPQLKLSEEKMLQAFEPSVSEPYRLGPGDEFTLDFPGRPELTKEGSGKMVVGPDGRITLPLAGTISITDKTREEAQNVIAEAMSAYYTNLTVTLRIDKYSSNKITVFGYVQHPGPMFFDETPTLLDAIARAGLGQASATGGSVGLTNASRDGIPETCTIYRGHDQVVNVELAALLRSGSPAANIRLRRNDIIFVPAQRENFVSVMGEVSKPGAIPLTPQSTVASVIAQAGSITDAAGDPKIHIFEASTRKETVIRYKDLVSLKAGNEITLHSGDVIFVPKSGFYKATYVLQRLSSVATLAALVTLAAP
jgi:polysaccharide export outer membrane protein